MEVPLEICKPLASHSEMPRQLRICKRRWDPKRTWNPSPLYATGRCPCRPCRRWQDPWRSPWSYSSPWPATGRCPGPCRKPTRDAGTPRGREIQYPGKPLGDAPAPVRDFEPAETANIPQLDGADPDLDTLCDPHSGHFFNAENCKKESEKCQYRGTLIIPGYIKSDLHNLNDYCMKVCANLNYGHIQESLNEQFKYTQIYTNFRKWRKCPKHFHLSTKNYILRYIYNWTLI